MKDNEQQAARDMAIAEEVRRACLCQFQRKQAPAAVAIAQLDLSRIIARVRLAMEDNK